MSTFGYAQARRTRERAAKERRKKLLLAGGLGLFLVVLVIQVPRTLNMFKSDSSSATPSGGVTTTTPTQAQARKASRQALRFLRAQADDPFASRRITDAETRPGAVGASGGLHDPFLPNSATPASPAHRVALPMPNRIIVGTPGRRAPKVGWTVVLASIPTSHSRGQAVRFARSARAHGVSNAAVLKSSTRNKLRPGYWVVYSGTYRNLSGVQRAAAQVHARGYRTAYIRQLVRY